MILNRISGRKNDKDRHGKMSIDMTRKKDENFVISQAPKRVHWRTRKDIKGPFSESFTPVSARFNQGN